MAAANQNKIDGFSVMYQIQKDRLWCLVQSNAKFSTSRLTIYNQLRKPGHFQQWVLVIKTEYHIPLFIFQLSYIISSYKRQVYLGQQRILDKYRKNTCVHLVEKSYPIYLKFWIKNGLDVTGRQYNISYRFFCNLITETLPVT